MKYSKNIISKIIDLISPKDKWNLYKVIFILTVASIIEVAVVTLITSFISSIGSPGILEDNIFLNQQFKLNLSIEEYIFFLIFILVISTIFSLYALKLSLRYSAILGMKIGDDLLNLYTRMSLARYQLNNVPDLSKRVTVEAQRVADGIVIPIIQLFSKSSLSLLMLSVLFLYNPFITSVLIVIFFIFYAVNYLLKKDILSINSIDISKLLTKRFEIVALYLNNFEYYKVNKGSNLEAFKKAGYSFALKKSQNLFLGQSPKLILEFIIFTLLLTSVVVMAGQGKFISDIAFYGMISFKLLPAMQQVYLRVTQIRGHIGSLNAIYKDFFINIKDKKIIEPKTSIELANLKKYNKNFNKIRIAVSKKYLLKGKSGAGKSTILKIIMGLIEPDDGSVYIDEKPSNDYLLDCSYLPQKLNFGDIYIKDFFNSYDENYVIEMFKKYNLAYHDSPINTYSGGEQQRIALIKTILLKKKFIILDESSSALDKKNEESFLEYFTNLNITLIVISHRDGIDQYFDEVINL